MVFYNFARPQQLCFLTVQEYGYGSSFIDDLITPTLMLPFYLDN